MEWYAWLLILFMIGAVACGIPFIISVVETLKNLSEVMKDLGDEFVKIANAALYAVDTIFKSCQEQSALCIAIEVFGGAIGLSWFCLRVALPLANGVQELRGKNRPFPPQEEQTLADRIAVIQATRTGEPEINVRLSVNGDIVRNSKAKIEVIEKAYQEKFKKPFTPEMRSKVGAALVAQFTNSQANYEVAQARNNEERARASETQRLTQARSEATREEAKQSAKNEEEAKFIDESLEPEAFVVSNTKA